MPSHNESVELCCFPPFRQLLNHRVTPRLWNLLRRSVRTYWDHSPSYIAQVFTTFYIQFQKNRLLRSCRSRVRTYWAYSPPMLLKIFTTFYVQFQRNRLLRSCRSRVSFLVRHLVVFCELRLYRIIIFRWYENRGTFAGSEACQRGSTGHNTK